MKKNNFVFVPFRLLELQLQLEKVELEWEEARERYNSNKSTVEDVDNVLKLTVEKIKILTEIALYTYET